MGEPAEVEAPPSTPGGVDLVLPTRDDPLVAASSEGAGGPAGTRVRSGGGWWTPLRVLMALTLLAFGAGVVSKAPCRADGWPRTGVFEYVHACYSDVPYLYRERGLAAGRLPYLDTDVEYPVLTGAVMGVTAEAVRATGAGAGQAGSRRFYDLNALLLGVLAVVTVVGVARLAGRRPWDAALVALAPAAALSATVNWDLLAVAPATLALLAWARRRPGWAGVLLGLSVAAKFYPVVLLGPLFLLALRAGRVRAFWRTVLGAAVTWAVLDVPVMIAAPTAWADFYTFSADRQASFGSPWYWFSQVVHPLARGTVNVLGTGTFLVLALAVAALALRAPRRPRLAQLAFLTVAAFCLTNKVYSPQYVLWLVPLAALARPRWRDVLAWQACEVVYFVTVWLYLASFDDTERGIPHGAYWLALWVHVAGTLYLAGVVVRDVLRPELDPVRADGSDDPGGGVLDHAPDTLVLAR